MVKGELERGKSRLQLKLDAEAYILRVRSTVAAEKQKKLSVDQVDSQTQTPNPTKSQE